MGRSISDDCGGFMNITFAEYEGSRIAEIQGMHRRATAFFGAIRTGLPLIVFRPPLVNCLTPPPNQPKT